MVTTDAISKQITAQAAQWLVRLEDTEQIVTARQQAEFFDWLRESSLHVKAFFKVADLWRRLEHFDPTREVDLEKLIAERLPNVRLLNDRVRPAADPAPPRKSWLPAAGLVAAAAGVLLVTAWVGPRLWAGYFGYRTGVGEQRTVHLEDGSVLQLNTRSRVKVTFSPKERRIDLLEGEALFSVEHESVRPFVVHTRSAMVQALGTQFNVYEHGQVTTVGVVEGAVQVTEHSRTEDVGDASTRTAAALVPEGPVVVLSTGETARVAAGHVSKRVVQDVREIAAWRQKRLVFRDVPLAQVAEEFNRYNTVQIRPAADVGQSARLTGIFSSDHPQSLVLYLEHQPTLSVTRSGDVYVVNARDGSIIGDQ